MSFEFCGIRGYSAHDTIKTITSLDFAAYSIFVQSLPKMSESKDVDQINEEAVELLTRGNFREAVPLFDRALGFLMIVNDKSTSSGCDHSVATKSTYVGNDDSCSSLDESFSEAGRLNEVTEPAIKVVIDKDEVKQFPVTTSAIQSVSITPGVKNEHQSVDNIFEFYPCALVLPKTNASCREGQTCIILYNMGVAYHNEAIRLREDPSSVLESCLFSYYQCALNLYNMAQLHLHQAWSKIDDEGTKLLLALALSNNSGHIHAQQLSFKETQYSLEAVRHFMHSIPEDATSEEIGISNEDYEFFTRTSLIFEDNNLDIAPSA
jgi:hypothetical protein